MHIPLWVIAYIISFVLGAAFATAITLGIILNDDFFLMLIPTALLVLISTLLIEEADR